MVAGGERLLLTARHLAAGGEVEFKHLCEPEIVVNLNLNLNFLTKGLDPWQRIIGCPTSLGQLGSLTSMVVSSTILNTTILLIVVTTMVPLTI